MRKFGHYRHYNEKEMMGPPVPKKDCNRGHVLVGNRCRKVPTEVATKIKKEREEAEEVKRKLEKAQELKEELEKSIRSLRGSPPPSGEQKEIQKHNRKLQRVTSALRMLQMEMTARQRKG